MKLLELDGDDIKITAEARLIVEFKKLIDEDRTKANTKVKQQFTYIYFFCEFESPYAKYPELERQAKIVEDLNLDMKNVKIQSVKAAVIKYEELSMTLSSLLLRDAESSVQKLREYFRNVDLLETNEKGALMYSAKDLMANLKSVGDVVKGLKVLKEEIKKEQVEVSSIKGGGMAGDFEDI